MKAISAPTRQVALSILDHNGSPIFRRNENSEIRLKEISEIFARQEKTAPIAGGFNNVWVYSIISSIATKIAQTPSGWWSIAPGARGISFNPNNWIPNHENDYSSLLEYPNEWQDKQRFIEQWVTFLLGGGNVWQYLMYDRGSKIPTGILLFSSKEVKPIRSSPGQPPVGWRLTLAQGKPIDVPLDAMIHTMMPNQYDQYIGLPPWAAVSRQLSADQARILYDEFFFKNNATPDTVLTYKPGPLNEDNRRLIQEAWFDTNGGPEHAGGVAVLGGDFDIKVLGINHAQSQFLQSRDFTRQEIASCYGYPAQLLNDTKTSGIGKDQLSVARTILWENAIVPIAVKFENAVSKIPKMNRYRKDIRYFFDYDGLPVMIDFLQTKSAILKTFIESGIPINEAMAKLDIGIKNIEYGDVSLVSNSLKTLEEVTTPIWEIESQKVEATADVTQDEANPSENEQEEEPMRTPKQIYNARVNSVGEIVEYLQRKIKRILFDIKNESFNHLDQDSPFDRDKYKERWIDTIFYVNVLCAYIGDASAKGRNVTLTQESVRTFLENLRKNENKCINKREDIIQDLIGQANNSYDIILDLWNNLRKNDSKKREEMVNVICDDLITKAREIATRSSLWARNAGEFYGSTSTITLKRSRGCPHTGRYPGDPKSNIGKILNCLCVCVSEPEVNYA